MPAMYCNDNPNNVGLFSSFIIIVFLLVKPNKIISIIYKYILIFSFLVFGIWTQSRTFVITMFVTVTFYFIYSGIKSKKLSYFLKIGLIISLSVCAFLILYIYFPPFTTLVSRFFLEDGGGGRIEITKDYLFSIIKKPINLLFGFSLTDLNYAINIETSPHSNFLQAVCAYGIFGFSVLTYFGVVAFINRTRTLPNLSQNLLLLLPTFTIILFTSMIQSLYPFHLLYPFILGFAFISQDVYTDNCFFAVNQIFTNRKIVKNASFYQITI